MRKLIMIPFAEVQNYTTGSNMLDRKDRKDVYLKNCSVACISARKNAGEDTDVALVTNMHVSEPYKTLLEKNHILIINVPFDCFDFGASYTWSLAFYKLCALWHISRECDYEYLCYLDSDVYVQDSFEHIWEEAKHHILLFDLGHGLNIPQYINVANEFHEFLGNDINITQYGGEFVAANRQQAIMLSSKCYDIYQEMLKREFMTRQGDEFILSVAASQLKEHIKHAGAYIFRFHTGTFRLCPARYLFNPVVVLHVPNEKTSGFLSIYGYLENHDRLPANPKVWKKLHLTKKSFRTVLSETKSFFSAKIKKILG